MTKAIYPIAEFPALSLQYACEMAEKWKQYYEEHGYTNVLFSIIETNLKYRFRVVISGRVEDEEDVKEL